MNFENRPEVWSLSCVYHKQAGNKIRLSSKEGIDCRPRLSQETKKKDLGDVMSRVPPWLQPKQHSTPSVYLGHSCLPGT